MLCALKWPLPFSVLWLSLKPKRLNKWQNGQVQKQQILLVNLPHYREALLPKEIYLPSLIPSL